MRHNDACHGLFDEGSGAAGVQAVGIHMFGFFHKITVTGNDILLLWTIERFRRFRHHILKAELKLYLPKYREKIRENFVYIQAAQRLLIKKLKMEQLV